MTFEASGLPAGLKLDTSTGFITGKTELRGDFKVLLKAMNEKGVAEKEITLKIGDRIALTPPMGWNSWNCWGLSVDDEKVPSCRAFHAESPSTKASTTSKRPANRVPSPAGSRCSARFLRDDARRVVVLRFLVAILLCSPHL